MGFDPNTNKIMYLEDLSKIQIGANLIKAYSDIRGLCLTTDSIFMKEILLTRIFKKCLQVYVLEGND